MADWHIARKDDAPDTNEEAWADAVERVAFEYGEDELSLEELVQTLAVGDDALRWIAGAVQVPAHLTNAMGGLMKAVASIRNQVEFEMRKEKRDARLD